MPLSTKKRKAARAKIEEYHQKKLAELQKYVFDKFGEFHQGKISAFDLDYAIHIYHKQSKELFSFINLYYPKNDSLEMMLKMIEEEKGQWSWEPKAKQK